MTDPVLAEIERRRLAREAADAAKPKNGNGKIRAVDGPPLFDDDEPKQVIVDNVKAELERVKAERNRIRTAVDIFAVPNHIDTLVAGLGIKPGPPVMFAARSGIGKSVVLQAAAVDSALGKPWWGAFPVQRKLKILWVDLEQGEQTTLLRFKRLALALDLTPDDLLGQLEVRFSPELATAAQVATLLAGYDIAFFDCFRVLAGGIDENDSRSREPLDILSQASDASKCATIIIHHGRKEVENNRGGARDATRGSSAIQDACDAVYHFGRDGDLAEGPIECTCTKTPRATGKAPKDWVLEIEDCDLWIGANESIRDGGLRVTSKQAPPVDQFQRDRDNRRVKQEKVRAALLTVLVEQPNWESAAKLAAAAHVRKADLLDAIANWESVERLDGKGIRYKSGHDSQARSASFPVVPGTPEPVPAFPPPFRGGTAERENGTRPDKSEPGTPEPHASEPGLFDDLLQTGEYSRADETSEWDD